MFSQLDLESTGQVNSKKQKKMPQGAINMPSNKKCAGIRPVTGVQLICQICYE